MLKKSVKFRIDVVALALFLALSTVFVATEHTKAQMIDLNPPELQLDAGEPTRGTGAVESFGVNTELYDILGGVAGGTYNIDAKGGAPIFRAINAIINIVFGILGVAAVILIIYAGFLWLTAGGNEDNISKAKSILKQVVGGFIILTLVYAITRFVIGLVTAQPEEPVKQGQQQQQQNPTPTKVE